MHICMTGSPPPAVETPYFGSVVAKLRPATANMPSLCLAAKTSAGDVQHAISPAASFGAAYSPLARRHRHGQPRRARLPCSRFRYARDVSQERLRDGCNSCKAQGLPVPGASAASMEMFQERAVDLVTGPQARRAFDLGLEPTPDAQIAMAGTHSDRNL